MQTQFVNGLEDLGARYDALLCDIWGVLHNGRNAFPDAYAALKQFKTQFGSVVLISNSPRPKGELIKQLDGLGIGPDGYSDVISSGDATRTTLTGFRDLGPCLKIGDSREDGLYEGLGLDLSGIAKTAAFICCTSPYHDETDAVEDYRDLFTECQARDLPFICANPDKAGHRGNKLILCAGALAELYENLGGKVIMAGKPFAPIYELCYASLETIVGKPVSKSRILAIGDGLNTDALGATRQGLDLLFIMGGLHGSAMLNEQNRVDREGFESLKAAAAVEIKFAMPNLSW